jgi:hypothetical protein
MGNGRAGGAIMQTAAQIDQICAARSKIINHLVTAPNGGSRSGLVLRSVTENGRALPPGSRDRQAAEFSVHVDYRAAPAR